MTMIMAKVLEAVFTTSPDLQVMDTLFKCADTSPALAGGRHVDCCHTLGGCSASGWGHRQVARRSCPVSKRELPCGGRVIDLPWGRRHLAVGFLMPVWPVWALL